MLVERDSTFAGVTTESVAWCFRACDKVACLRIILLVSFGSFSIFYFFVVFVSVGHILPIIVLLALAASVSVIIGRFSSSLRGFSILRWVLGN